MKRTALTILFFISGLITYSQITFETHYGTPSHDVGYSVQQTFDGSYIVAGTTYETATGDGDVYFAQLDSTGHVLWTKTYGGLLEDGGACVKQAADSGYVILGSTDNFGSGESDVYLIKTNQTGDTLWTKTYGGTDFDYGNSIENTFDGGFIISGQESSTDSIGVANLYLVKTNSMGDTLWTKSIPMVAWAGAIETVQTLDSGYVVFGDFENSGVSPSTYDLVWIKTDASGNIQWTKTFEDTVSHDYASAIRQTMDGGFVLASIAEDQWLATYSSRLIRLDANGDTMWTKSFGAEINFSVGDVVETGDSGLVNVGYGFDTVLFSNYLYLIKMNSAGDSLWTVILDGMYSATGHSIEETSDGGLILCGLTYDTTLVQGEVYVVKTDGNGFVNQCQQVLLSQPSGTLIEEGADATFSVTSSTAVAYQWQIDTAGAFVNLTDTLMFSGTTSDTLIVSSTTLAMDDYQFRVFATDSAGCTDTSVVVTLTVTNTIGIKSLSQDKIFFYPNPAHSMLEISGTVPESATIFDVYGKSVAQFSNSKTFDVSFLSSGLYIMKLMYAHREITGRFIKN